MITHKISARHVPAPGFLAPRAFRLRVPPVSGFLRPRLIAVNLLVIVVTFLLVGVTVWVGDTSVGFLTAVQDLVGIGDPVTVLIVQELMLPRVLTGLLVGIAFGLSGALFQTMTRNPLASPDVIGLTQGSATAVVAAITLGFDGLGMPALGMLGAFASALLVYLLAWRRGITGYRIILIGIGVSWMCISATDFLIARGGQFQAQAALGWLVGNLNGTDWPDLLPLAFAMIVLVPVSLVFGRALRTLQLGDDLAASLGTRVQVVRLAVLVAGVGLIAFGTAAAGPIAFVALMAPQIAQRLGGTAWPPPITAALTGGLVVVGSDLIAMTMLGGTELPVGVVTGAFGAPVLLWLLLRANRTGSGG